MRGGGTVRRWRRRRWSHVGKLVVVLPVVQPVGVVLELQHGEVVVLMVVVVVVRILIVTTALARAGH